MRELALIVMGVLIALAVDAWWEGRRDRSRELVNMRLLIATTHENQSRTNAAITFDSLSQHAAEQVLSALRTGGVALPLSDSLTRLAYRGGWWSDFHPLIEAYGALANSGELTLIQSDTVRAQIVRITGELTGTVEQIRSYDDTANRIWETLGGFFDAVSAARAFNAGNPAFAFRLPIAGSSGSPTHWRTLQASPAFQQALFLAWANAANRLVILRRLRSDLDKLERTLVEAYQARGGASMR